MADGRARRPPGSARAGLTLLELLLVMALLAVVLGASLGLLTSIDVGRRQALGLVKNVVRSAQNTALALRAPTSVRIDRERRTLTPLVWRVVGTWHFEDALLTGAFDRRGALIGGRIVEDGYVGRALSFVGEPPGSRAELDVGSLDLTDGFSLECALYRTGNASFRALNAGDACGLDVLGGGKVRGWFVPGLAREDGLGLARGGPVVVESALGALPLERWTRVRLDYDRRVLRLSLDGLEVEQRPEDAMVHPLDGPLTLSEERTTFPGVLDNLVVRALVREGEAELPDGVVFAPEAPASVHFDAGGGLDRRVHTDPVRIPIVYTDGTREVVQVGTYGTVEGGT